MRKINLTLALAVVSLFAIASLSSAEEELGLLQRLKNRFTPQKKAEEPAKTKEVKLVSNVEATAKVTPEAQDREGPVKPRKTRNEMTGPELVERIRNLADQEEEVVNFTPGLKQEKGEDGNTFYTYEGVKLEDLDREKLDKILSRVQNEAVRIRTDRLNRQLESIRMAQQATENAQRASQIRPPAISAPPQQPPRIPQPPQSPPNTSQTQAPKPPPVPPAPPRR